MCTCNCQLDSKAGRLRRIAGLFAVLGILPIIFRGSIHGNQAWLHAFSGLFLGLSIGINLYGIRACRARQNTPPGAAS